MSTELQPTTLPDDNSSLDLNPRAAGSKDSDFELEEKAKAPPKPISSREAIEKAAAEIGLKDEKVLEDDTKPAKAEPKPEPKAKEEPETAEAKAARERGEDGKFKPKEPTEQSDGVERTALETEKPKPSEGKGVEAPARFLPRAKEVWQNTPNPVKEEVHRALQEAEQEVTQAREAVENWKQLEAFDREAKAHGTTVPQYIQNVRAIEQLLRTNPIEGLERVARTAGYSLEQIARHILQQPADQQTQRRDQGMQQLQQQNQQLTQTLQTVQKELEAMRLERVADKHIEPFVREHPRYHELEADIAFFLTSGKIPSSLSERQRLETAYDMAERINPTSSQQFNPQTAAPEPEAKRVNPAGEKSIKGAPGSGNETGRKTKGKLSTRESIEAAMAEMGLGN
jgi:hypothetical protein